MIDLNVGKPDRVARLPHYKGIPIPYTTLIVNEKPDFRATDTDKIWEVKRDKKCSICGEHLDYYIAFIATENEIKTQFILENPNHEECLRFAFAVCPWLYYSKMQYSDIEKILPPEGIAYQEAHPERFGKRDRPDKLAIYICRSYKNEIRGRYRGCKVSKPVKIEWIEGK